MVMFCSLPLPWLSLLAVCWCGIVNVVRGQQRTFVDDHGVTHRTTKARPTFITRARTALNFHHMGKYLTVVELILYKC